MSMTVPGTRRPRPVDGAQPGRGHGVVATRVEGMAAGHPTHGQPAAAQRSVPLQRGERVAAAAGGEPAAWGQQRRQQPAVAGHPGDEDSRCDAGGSVGCGHVQARCRVTLASAPSRSEPSDLLEAAPARDPALTTSLLPAGRAGSRSRSRCRRRRAVRWRTTDPPTDLPTTRPTRDGAGAAPPDGRVVSSSAPASRCTVTRGRDARRPRRTTSVNSVERRSRCSGGSMRLLSLRRLRRTARRGLCGDALPESPGRPESASSAGNRVSWHGDGCSAGRCACSRRDLLDGGGRCRRSAGWLAGDTRTGNTGQGIATLVREEHGQAR